MIIAIDGPAGSGKSTIAKLIAKDIGLVYLDTGAMYRLVTLKALNEGILGNGKLSDLGKIKKLLDNLNIDIKENGFYLDDVEGLGTYIKLERALDKGKNEPAVRQELWDVLRVLGIDETNNEPDTYTAQILKQKGIK
mgnify:CR=1 FL=1